MLRILEDRVTEQSQSQLYVIYYQIYAIHLMLIDHYDNCILHKILWMVYWNRKLFV